MKFKLHINVYIVEIKGMFILKSLKPASIQLIINVRMPTILHNIYELDKSCSDQLSMERFLYGYYNVSFISFVSK